MDEWTLTVLGSPLKAEAAWEKFCASEADWLERVNLSAPLYCLPEAAIKSLRKPHKNRPAVLDAVAAGAEQDLTTLCRQLHAVGFWNGLPVPYPYLTPSIPIPDKMTMHLAGWSEAQRLQAEQAIKKAAESRERLKGYAGWLVIEPAFLQEAARLAARWSTLSSMERPSLPLRRAVSLPEQPKGCTKASCDTVNFMDAFQAFCDRWDLVGMATWDLPEPQGPLIFSPLPAGSPAIPTHSLHITVPVYYPLLGDDALQRQVWEKQKAVAKERELDPSVAGLPHYKAYAEMLEAVHLEQTVTSRYGKPWGIVGQLEAALADTLDIGFDMVKKLRKAISACRSGRRGQIRWLLPAR